MPRTADCIDDLTRNNIIDSRDIEALLEEFKNTTTTCTNCDGEGSITIEGGIEDTCVDCNGVGEVIDWELVDKDEYKEVSELCDAQPTEDWIYGSTLVREDHWEDYAREYAEDIGALDDNARWPADCIDWEKAASELAMDYTTIEFGGHDWYAR